MKLQFLLLPFLLLSCTTKQTEHKPQLPATTDTPVAATAPADTTNTDTEIIETFADSLNIGRKGNCKIEIIKHRVLDHTYAIVKFYTRGPEYWYTQNTYLYECDALADLQPNISDFNNDQLNDLTFISATAARSANEVRRLFIYDDEEQRLISIVNAQDYPNMRYNQELDCVDAFLVHGGSTTVFTRIEGDSLKPFASVNNDSYRTVCEIDRSGNERVLRRDSIRDDMGVYVRYVNYKPLKRYKE